MRNEIEDIERTLSVLVSAMVTEDRKPVEATAPVALRAEPVTAESLERAARMTRLDLDVSDLLRGPVRAACRQAVRRLGERVYLIVGKAGHMSDVLERVADMVPAQYSHRATIIDSAWNGIGSGDDRWWS